MAAYDPQAENYAKFSQSQRTFGGIATTAITNMATTNPGQLVTLTTVGAKGGCVSRLEAFPLVTMTDMVLYLYVSRDGGNTKTFKDTVLLKGQTVSATSPGTGVTFTKYTEKTPMRLGPNEILYGGIANNGTIAFSGEISEFT